MWGGEFFKLIESIGPGWHNNREICFFCWMVRCEDVYTVVLIFSSIISCKETAGQDCSCFLQYKTAVEKIKEVMFETPVVMVKHPVKPVEEAVGNSKVRRELGY